MKYSALGGYTLRVPALPYSIFQHLQALTDDQLLTLFKLPFIKENIFLSSPLLYSKLEELANHKFLVKKEKDRVIHSFLKYLIRASTNPIPFGWLAGIKYGTEWGNKTQYKLIPEEYKKHIRLNYHTVHLLVNELEKTIVFPNNIIYYINNTLYQTPLKDFRYVKMVYHEKGCCAEIIKVHYSTYIESIKKMAMYGAKFTDIYHSMLNDRNLSSQEVIDFLKKLVDNQILVSELRPKAISADNFKELLECLRQPDITEFIKDKVLLREIEMLEPLIKPDIEALLATHTKINCICKTVENNIFHGDLEMGLKTNSLNENIVKSIIPKAIYVLSKLANIKITPLNKFKGELEKRFGNKRVRLVDVLDSTYGIGYNNSVPPSSALLKNISWPSSSSSTLFLNPVDRMFNHKLMHQKFQKNIEIRLSDEDLSPLPDHNNLIPETFSVFCNVVDENQYYFKVISSITAAGHVARFAYVDNHLQQLIKSIFEYEKKRCEDCLIAEVIHVPTQKIGNIALRSVSRDYEIPYYSEGTNTYPNQIHIDDLYVNVGLDDTLRLWSKQYNKQVIPKVSMGYNYIMSEFPIFQFLCDFQYENEYMPGLEFIWGELFIKYSFLPRLTYDNIIVSPARWRFYGKDFIYIRKLVNDLNPIEQLKMCRKIYNLPRFVYLSENENDLMIDLEGKNSLEILKVFINKNQELFLKEALFKPESSMIQEYNYINEYIIPIKKSLE